MENGDISFRRGVGGGGEEESGGRKLSFFGEKFCKFCTG